MKSWTSYPGDWGFVSRELGNFIPGIGIFLESGDFYDQKIFIPEIAILFIWEFLSRREGIFQNLKIFIPRIEDFLTLGFFWDGDFSGMGICWERGFFWVIEK